MTTGESASYDFEYEGWHVDLQSQMASDGKGWYARVVVMREEAGEWRSVPLEFKDSRVFPTFHEANTAAIELAKAWIDRQ